MELTLLEEYFKNKKRPSGRSLKKSIYNMRIKEEEKKEENINENEKNENENINEKNIEKNINKEILKNINIDIDISILLDIILKRLNKEPLTIEERTAFNNATNKLAKKHIDKLYNKTEELEFFTTLSIILLSRLKKGG